MDATSPDIAQISVGAAFVAGLVTVLSPCVLVMLPIIIGAGLQRRWWYPLAVAAGLTVSFAAVGIFLSGVIASLLLPPSVLKHLTVVVMLGFGAVLVSDKLSSAFSTLSGRVLAPFQSRLSSDPSRAQTGIQGLIAALSLGATLGLVWAPCAGPTMGAILTLAATSSPADAFVLMLVYASGNTLPMLIVAYGGRAASQRLLRLNGAHTLTRRVLGTLLIFFATISFFGLDKMSESRLIRAFPDFFDWVASY